MKVRIEGNENIKKKEKQLPHDFPCCPFVGPDPINPGPWPGPAVGSTDVSELRDYSQSSMEMQRQMYGEQLYLMVLAVV